MRRLAPLALWILPAVVFVAGSARAADDPPPPPVPAPLAPPPLEDRSMEFRGSVETGLRLVSGERGRYDQDLRLGDGFRLLSLDLRGTALEEGLPADSVDLRLHGLGDPDTRFDLRLRARDAYDLTAHVDRLEYGFLATADPHPFETVRTSEGVRLRFQPAKRLSVTLATDHVRRTGDAKLDHEFRDERSLPVPATIRYDGHTQEAGFDASPGLLRFGATAVRGHSVDASWRLLDHPDTPVADFGPFLNESASASRTLSARAGARLLEGKLDLSTSGSWTAAGTDSRVREDVVTTTYGSDGAPGGGDDLAWSTESYGTTTVDLAGRQGRAEVLWIPHPDWDLLARYEGRSTTEDGGIAMHIRVQTPPYGDPSGSFGLLKSPSGAEATLVREGFEARWRRTKDVSYRVGVERVRERVRTLEDERESWNPRTRIVTAGIDYAPSRAFDLSLLNRIADQRGRASQLSPGEAGGMSLRLRTRRDDGFHFTGYARTKSRSVESSNSEARTGAYGIAFGRTSPEGWIEWTAERRSWLLRSDTRFVVDLATSPVKSPRRVSFDEGANVLGLDFSRTVNGPLRAFGRVHGDRTWGDFPFARYDAALGLGWRVRPSTEIRLEGRHVVLNERNRSPDDYRADLVTLSVLFEF